MKVGFRYFFSLAILALTASSPSWAGEHPVAGLNPQVNRNPALQKAPVLQKAMEWIRQSASGNAILKLAEQMHVPIHEGTVSKTEMTATRTTDGNKESFRYSIQVLIARDKDPVFQALDLAHELTHATHVNANPFDPNLSAEEYVKRGIESDGGEAKAILQECRVGKELVAVIPEATGNLVKARCQFVWKMEPDENKWKHSFYQLGEYYRDFIQMLSHLRIDNAQKIHWAQNLEQRSPMFASAVTHKPYPLALLEEYIAITRKICEKPAAASGNTGAGRSLASTAIATASVNALNNRCQSVQNIP